MIERIARMLCGLAGEVAVGGPDASPQDAESEPNWRSFVPAARAVLDALREPTETMRNVGAEFFEEGDSKQNGFAAAIVYGAMIDAAIAEDQAGA